MQNNHGNSGGSGGERGLVSQSLSRNAIYAPLEAYEQTKLEPASYMSSQSSISALLKESSLTSFLQSIGEDYHRNRATGPDPKNNGSRPLSVSDMDDRLRQRAVTLVGGGINSSMTSSKTPSTTKNSSRKRPRREWSQVEGILQHCSPGTSPVTFLRAVNSLWNKYIHQIITPAGIIVDQMTALFVKRRIASARHGIEFSGAHSQIQTCSSKRHLEGVDGVILEETANTWIMAIAARPKKKKQRKRHGDDVSNLGAKDPSEAQNIPSAKDQIEVVLIPKKGTCIDVIIPSRLSMDTDADADAVSKLESQDPQEHLIPIAPLSYFVTLSLAKTT